MTKNVLIIAAICCSRFRPPARTELPLCCLLATTITDVFTKIRNGFGRRRKVRNRPLNRASIAPRRPLSRISRYRLAWHSRCRPQVNLAFTMPTHPPEADLAFTMPTHPPEANLAFTMPTHPPEADLAFTMPTHPPEADLAFTMPTHPPEADLAFTMPTHPPEADLAFTMPTHPPQAESGVHDADASAGEPI